MNYLSVDTMGLLAHAMHYAACAVVVAFGLGGICSLWGRR